MTAVLWSATARVSTSLTSFSATGAAFGCVFGACTHDYVTMSAEGSKSMPVYFLICARLSL